jgi:glycogen debranching enzyme
VYRESAGLQIIGANIRGMRTLLFVTVLLPALGRNLQITRTARTWEFLDAAGPRAAFFGTEEGTLEAWVYPLKVVKDLRLSFRAGARRIPASTVVRSVAARPGSYTLTYSGDDFQVEQTIAASIKEPGLLMRIAVRSYEPLTIEGEFVRDFQLMWPASIGSSYGEWNGDAKAWFFGADGQPFAAVFGGPHLEMLSDEYATNYSSSSVSRFTLGAINGSGERWLAIAGSVMSRDQAFAVWKRLLANPSRTLEDAASFYARYLDRTVRLSLPDGDLQRAYDWSRISVVKGMVNNPLLGRGLVAGYGPSKGAYRPGFAWFFGRDSFWTSFALTAAGDLESARTAIEFIAKRQRADGKIPHEISQSASLIPWFTSYPYGYASADATPLFVIAVRDYIDASGDLNFLRSYLPRLNSAMEFMRSTLGESGYPKNFGIGHGWVEGGPLLPVQVELYQAGCYVEALRSMAKLAALLGDSRRAAQLDREYKTKRQALDDLFWIASNQTYAFALDAQNKPVNEPSVLATVPMWFGVLDPSKARRMIETLAGPAHATDWGMRMIGENSARYGPAGYHFGSVWPLFTGWAAVGEYKSHMAEAAYQNLRANAWLALDGAGGNTTEVLSGAAYSPLSTSSPHQIWSAAMVVSPILRGLLGLSVDVPENRVTLAPHLPAAWDHVGVSGVHAGAAILDFELKVTRQRCGLEAVNRGSHPVEVEFAPALPPPVEVTGAVVNGAAAHWAAERNEIDWHPRVRFTANPGRSAVSIQHTPSLGYTVPWNPPALAETSGNLKVLSERWSPAALDLRVSGREGRAYELVLTDGRRIAVPIEGQGSEYRERQVRIPLPGEGR